MSRLFSFASVAVIVAASSSPAFAKKKAAPAHEHGRASLSLAVDGKMMRVAFECPGDSVFGFEHAAKNAAETKIVDDALKTLRENMTNLLGIPADLGCKVTVADVKHNAHQGHADVDATYTIECAKTPIGATLKPTLLARFPRLKQVNTQIVALDNQRALKLSAAASEIKL